MRFFKKRQKTGTSNTITKRMANYVERRQRKLADWLNHKMANSSRQELFFGLVIFCSVFGGYLLYLLLNTFGVFR